MKALFIISDGFEDMEYTCPHDLLSRAGYETVTASGRIENDKKNPIQGREGAVVTHFETLSNLHLEDFDVLVIPGGPHFKEIEQNEKVLDIIRYFASHEEKYLAAICAAPTILGHLGLLKGRNYTVFPSMNEDFGGHFLWQYVVIDHHLITGDGPAAAITFGLAILKAMKGEKASEAIAKEIYYNHDGKLDF